MKIRNRRGDRQALWGTPDVTLASGGGELFPVFMFYPSGGRPRANSLASSRSCGMRSNDLAKSTKIASI